MPCNFNRFTIHKSFKAISLQMNASSSTGIMHGSRNFMQTVDFCAVDLVFRLISRNKFCQMQLEIYHRIVLSAYPVTSTKTTHTPNPICKIKKFVA